MFIHGSGASKSVLLGGKKGEKERNSSAIAPKKQSVLFDMFKALH